MSQVWRLTLANCCVAQGEIGFFGKSGDGFSVLLYDNAVAHAVCRLHADYYIIPLVNKLKDCGVFGVSSSEYLDYALRNREEWKLRGREVVEEMIANVKKHEDSQQVEEEGW